MFTTYLVTIVIVVLCCVVLCCVLFIKSSYTEHIELLVE